jgi:CYTH domain-containing protein
LKEIERKFLVHKNVNEFLSKGKSFVIKQGYLQRSKECTVRVRIKNDKGYLTIKGASQNYTRDEFEYEIPVEEATQLLDLCGHFVLDKIRYEVEYEGKTWEIDVFKGKLEGLFLAEIELQSENEEFTLPPWIDKEVSLDPRFTNSNLVALKDLRELKI